MKEKDDKLNKKIKTSFGQMDRKAPDLLWKSLSASLDEAASSPSREAPDEQSLYQRIRESFSAQDKKAPSHVWQSINKQLNIDLVWTKINRELDGVGSAEKYRWQWIAAAAVLLLITGFAGLYFVKRENAVTLSGGKADLAIASPKTAVAGDPVISMDVENGRSKAPDSTGKQQMPGQYSNEENLPEHQANQQEKDLLLGERREIVSGPATGLHNNTGLSGKKTVPPFMAESGANFSGSLSRSEIAPLLQTKQAALRPASRIVSVAFDSLGYRYMGKGESNTAATGPEKRLMLSRISLGLAISYNNSWLLNNETQRSFDKGSLISTSPTFNESVGLSLGYHLGHRSFVSTELHMAKTGQEYKTFRGGSYIKKGLELTYYKGYVQYQHRFLPDRKSLLSDITLRAGIFAGLLHERQGELRDTESSYSQYDYGVRGALGQERQIGGLTIGYGISVERGLKNIFLGSENMPGRFNRTYTLNVGPYLNLRLDP